jgi:hypothetical protein
MSAFGPSLAPTARYLCDEGEFGSPQYRAALGLNIHPGLLHLLFCADRASKRRLHQGFPPGEMGFNDKFALKKS